MPTKIKQIAHKARSKSSLSLVQVLATALAAITMAFVSTRVTSAFNSFVAVGIISVLSALVAEFWRFTIRVGAESAQAIVVEPLLKISAEDPVEGVGVEATDDSVIIDAPEGSSPGDDPTSVEVAIGETEPAVPAPTNGKLLLRTLWRSTPVRLSLLFLLLGSLTVGVSYIVARSQGQPDTHVTYSPVQQLTEAEKQELLDAAALIAEQHAQETIDEANGGLPTPDVPTELPDPTTTEELQAWMDRWQLQIEGLETQLNEERERNDELQQRLDELEALVEQMENQNEDSRELVQPTP